MPEERCPTLAAARSATPFGDLVAVIDEGTEALVRLDFRNARGRALALDVARAAGALDSAPSSCSGVRAGGRLR